ncbi:predicted protein, partial [Nematostella vectensis]
SESLVVVESILLCTVLCVSLTGNLLVFSAVYRNRRLRTISNMFVVTLAASDALMASLCMPYSLGTLIHGRWIFGERFCQAQGFFAFNLGLASLNTMFFVAVNRFFCIVKPAKYQIRFSKGKTRIYLLIIWFNSFAGSIPPLFFYSGGYDFQPGKAMCLYRFESNIPYTVFLEALFIGLPLNIIAFCYLSVFREVRRTNKVFTSANATRAELRAHVQETKITKTLGAVFLGYVSCWMPVSIIDYLDAANGKPIYHREVYMAYMFLIYISSMINPLIYGLASRAFRREYEMMI